MHTSATGLGGGDIRVSFIQINPADPSTLDTVLWPHEASGQGCPSPEHRPG